ncbi:hypothetical protein [Methylopila sp. M107]|uniref:hypothetical protein n=1 Tax=Methylopila sp. M107 TaxID=1101190 RepID=UPI00036A611B|nr:hypothetical protein [Methylopila sp. M107]
MCPPLALAGLALSAGSALANASAQRQVANARDDAMEAERLRQAAFDKRAQNLNTKSQDRYQNFGGKQAKRAGKLGDYFQGDAKGRQTGADKVNAGGVLPASSSNITVAAEKRSLGDAAKYVDQQGAALGDLRAFGDLVGQIGRGQARDATTIGQIGDSKKGSAQILPLELEAANQQGSGLRLVGDIAQGFGSLGIAAGLAKSPVEPGHSLGGGLGPINATTARALPPSDVSAALASIYGDGSAPTGPTTSGLNGPSLLNLYSGPRRAW